MQLWIVFVLLIITNAIGTFSYASRLAGVQMRSINNSGTIYNAMTMFSRLSNMFLLPFIGALVENAIRTGDIEGLTNDFRILLLGSALGVLIAGLLIPTMSDVFINMIQNLKSEKSLIKAVRKEMNIKGVKKHFSYFRLPSKETFSKLSIHNVPKGFLVINIFTACVYSVGFLAALYSGALMPEYRLVSSNLSSAINGFATIALFILVDPIFNVITDEVLDEKNPRQLIDLKSTIAAMTVTKFIGILLAQFLLVPAAHFISFVAQFFI